MLSRAVENDKNNTEKRGKKNVKLLNVNINGKAFPTYLLVLIVPWDCELLEGNDSSRRVHKKVFRDFIVCHKKRFLHHEGTGCSIDRKESKCKSCFFSFFPLMFQFNSNRNESKILVALTFVQIVSRISCLPTTSYVISSYSNVRLQQPTIGLSVESPMPMEIMMNPVLADEPPTQVDKMESIFMKSDQIKNIKTMNIDEEEIMMSINKLQNTQQPNTENVENITNVYEESDLMGLGMEVPAAFSIASNVKKASDN